jgi:hypothetical protein
MPPRVALRALNALMAGDNNDGAGGVLDLNDERARRGRK